MLLRSHEARAVKGNPACVEEDVRGTRRGDASNVRACEAHPDANALSAKGD